MEVRFSTENDHFIAIDGEAPEIMPADELIYVSGNTVKTRRWIWRQSDDGKITGDTHHIFYPIDGFGDVSRDDVMAACNELAETLRKEFGCSIKSGFIDKSNPVFDLSI